MGGVFSRPKGGNKVDDDSAILLNGNAFRAMIRGLRYVNCAVPVRDQSFGGGYVDVVWNEAEDQ